MSARVRVAVVGVGIGQEHLHAYRRLSDLFDVVAVCDAAPDRAIAAAERWEVPHSCTDLTQLLDGGGFDVVDLCTPPYLHVAHVEAAFDAGYHVLCEKPLAGSLADVDRLAEAAHATGLRLMPIFQYRFGHGLQKLRQLVTAGITGRAFVSTVEVAWRRRADYYAVPWRGRWETELGGVLLSHGTHALDMLCFVLGDPVRVFARTSTRVNPIEVDDCASASIEMADGSLVSVTATLGSAAEISRHRFCFENLTAESNTSPYRSSAEPWTFSADTPDHAEKMDAVLAAYAAGPQGYAGQFAGLHAALTADAELPVTVADARRSLELVTAVYESSRTGTDVALPITADHPAYTGWIPEAFRSA